MRISYNLLKTLIDFDWPPDKVAERLTMSGSEVESIEVMGPDVRGIVAAKVSGVRKMADSGKLSVCEVFDGKGKYDVVCGAPNLSDGQIVLYAPPGSRIPGTKIEKTKIHGVESSGMILSEAELGLSDIADVISVLESTIKPGTTLEKIVDYKDTIFELEITPNRPDCLSHIGIAREIQALGGGTLRLPRIDVRETDEEASAAVKIKIDDPLGCPRYTGRVIRNLNIAPSPLWLKMIVYYLGMRPINNVVDITNFVMLELGHPLHAFDFDLFHRPEVLVRRAKQGEEFLTLDGMTRKLNKEHLLITDGRDGVAIAGIMGGERSEVSTATRNVLLESAYFDPVAIRRGSKALGLATESSRRFERGADPNMAQTANDRAGALIADIAGGRMLKGIIDNHPAPFVPVEIELRPNRVNMLLGTDLSRDRMIEILGGLEIEFSSNGTVRAKQPSFRPDLTREIDLIEEIARIDGLENIEPRFRPGGELVTPESKEAALIRKTRSYLCGLGATEIFSFTLVDSRMTSRFGLGEKCVKILNPISEEMAVVRPDLILSALPVIRRNIGFREKDLFLFEIGNIHVPQGKGKLPSQRYSLMIARSGFENPVFWGGKARPCDLYSLLGTLEDLADYLHMGAVELRPAEHFAFERTRSFEIVVNEAVIGYAGMLSSEGCSIADIKGEVYLAEVDFEMLVTMVPETLETSGLARFPSADRDIAIVVDDAVKSADIRKAIIEGGGDLIEDVWIFDLYRGKNIPDGKKSLAYGIKYRLADRTLTDEEVDNAHREIARLLNDRYGAELRS